MCRVRKEPITEPKVRNPERELLSFLNDMENMIKELKMDETPLQRFLAYVIVYDCLVKLDSGFCYAELRKSNTYINIMLTSAHYQKHFKKINPKRLAVQKTSFEEWLCVRISTRNENFSYEKAMLIIEKRIENTIKENEVLADFKDLFDRCCARGV